MPPALNGNIPWRKVRHLLESAIVYVTWSVSPPLDSALLPQIKQKLFLFIITLSFCLNHSQTLFSGDPTHQITFQDPHKFAHLPIPDTIIHLNHLCGVCYYYCCYIYFCCAVYSIEGRRKYVVDFPNSPAPIFFYLQGRVSSKN